MSPCVPGPFGTQLKQLREAAGFTQEELATIAGLSVHAVSALERGHRRRPHVETVRALAGALDLSPGDRDAFVRVSRATPERTDANSDVSPLPHVLTPLVGRAREVRELSRWLADPSARVVTLVGPGGVGKTRLALEVARDLADAGTARAVFVGLASISDADFVASAIAEAFGVVDIPPADLPKRLRAASAGRPTLLLLDNCEHVLDAVPLVASLLSEIGSLRVLATSRAPLRVRGEREYLVEPLAMAADAERPLDRPTIAPAVQLFVDRVRDCDPEFALTDANTRVVESICRRLDALPLAIELTAPWARVLSPEDLLRRLDRDVLSTSMARRDLPERQQTMTATVAWSYRLLARDEQQAFMRFGVLPGQFSIEAAAAVCGDATPDASDAEHIQRIVAGLMERSLLVRAERAAGHRPLYRMLDTVRAYAAGELIASGEHDATMAALAGYCGATAAAAADHLTGSAQGEWLDRVRDDLETFRSAIVWLIDSDRAADACAIAWHLLWFWLIRGHAAEGLHWYERLAASASLSSSDRAVAYAGAGAMWYAQGDLERARDASEQSLACCDRPPDALSVALAEDVLGHVELASGNPGLARARFASAAERFKQLAVAWGVGNATAGLAGSALAQGDIEAADRHLTDAAHALRHVGPWFSQIVLYLRALAAVRRNKPDAAIEFIRESLTRIHALRDKFALVYALVPLAAAAHQSGDEAWAARLLGMRDAVTERTGAIAAGRSVRDLQDRIEREGQARLGRRRWAREYEAGRRGSLDSLIEEIDVHRQRAATT